MEEQGSLFVGTSSFSMGSPRALQLVGTFNPFKILLMTADFLASSPQYFCATSGNWCNILGPNFSLFIFASSFIFVKQTYIYTFSTHITTYQLRSSFLSLWKESNNISNSSFMGNISAAPFLYRNLLLLIIGVSILRVSISDWDAL